MFFLSISDFDTRKSELERIFGKYGRLREVWMARNPPCFAFVVFKHQESADKAQTECDGMWEISKQFFIAINIAVGKP